MEQQKGVTETKNLTPMQWQLIMKCWKMNLRPGNASWWGPAAWRTGALALWAAVASVVFTGTTLTWLSFTEAIGFVGLAIVGLVAHELMTERIVHEFEAIPAGARDGRRSEEIQAAA